MIRNLEALLAHGLTEPRELALRVAGAGLAACDPGLAVERLVRLDGDDLVVDGHRHSLVPGGRVVVLGSGKATLRIAAALERVLGERISAGAVAVRHVEEALELERIELLEAAHPIPDDRSVAAGRRMLELAGSLGADDVAIACFTGGSSALTSVPPEGVSAAEKRELHRLLLGSGMPIGEINAVRKQVSAFKGGRLAAAAAPATVINLTVSDVAGNVLDTLTDPSVADTTTAVGAVSILRDRGLWDLVSASVRDRLSDSRQGPPDLGDAEVHSTLLVTGATACEAMATSAREAGVEGIVLSTSLEDEAAPIGRLLASLAAESAREGRPFPSRCVLLGCGGEANVRLEPSDGFGLGGPNGEAALAAASRLQGHPVAAVFLDTDGSDGGTDLAGGVSDGATADRAREAGLDLANAVATHRSGEVLAALSDGVETGPTHTNVNDLFAIAIAG